MSEETSQERTEEATPKRQQDVKKKGTVLRSRELNSVLNLLGGSIGLMIAGHILAENISHLTKKLYTLDRASLMDKSTLISVLEFSLDEMIAGLWPYLALAFIAVLLGPALIGGWTASAENFRPKLERLNPIKGLQRMVAIKGLMELVKSILKVVLVSGVSGVLLWLFFDSFMGLIHLPLIQSIEQSLIWLLGLFFLISSSLIIVAAIDVPFQIFEHQKKMKMTKQEVKDEFKETEGRPEVKSKIQRMQREMARRRMMKAMEEADVVITNPTHFAVALKYKSHMSAPVVVAKGADKVAERIRDKADELSIPKVSVPPLARALFYSTELEDEIPYGLYKAVARVLAYLYQLSQYKKGKAKKPDVPNDVDIPDEYQR